MIGQSPGLQAVLRQMEQVAPTDSTVLLLGETGTGKELVARAIHALSPRSPQRLVTVNCAALPGELLESELFGHVRGAFTTALDHRVGRFELADQGTLFLDEVAELSPAAQAKLLRVIQAGEFERLGSSETIRVNVRIIAATHQDLAWAIREGRFRADLHYRLAVFPIEVPPLRVRRDDIPLLVWHIVRRKQAKLGRNIDSVPQDIMERLMAHDWPGNVRELENVIERALILASDGTLRLGFGLGPCPAAPPADTQACDLRQVEREHILRVLQECDWKVKGRGNAAERLKLTVSTLRYRMKKLGLHPPPRVLPVV